jgi:two-component system nitrogen regulation response regulator NtrX
MAADVLVVDDEADIRDLVAGILTDEGYAVRTANDSESALAEIRARKPALLILDIWMQGGGMDGLELLDLVKGLDPDLPVIMISGHGNIETAVSAIKRGAYEFLEKPFKSDRLLLVVERALEAANLRRENRRLRARTVTPEGLIGRSATMQHLRGLIQKLAAANSRVLISGPPGAGKETVARMIHAASPRAGMTPERVDVELFGEEGEAGRPAKIGVFERAHGGTLYLDEVADMPRETQSRILRVLVDQRFRRVGGASDVQVDVRVVSSTCRDLRVEIAEGRFREDLFHRLNVVPLGVPGLAERREDIPDLVDFFVQKISEASGLPRRRLSDDALAALQVRGS